MLRKALRDQDVVQPRPMSIQVSIGLGLESGHASPQKPLCHHLAVLISVTCFFCKRRYLQNTGSVANPSSTFRFWIRQTVRVTMHWISTPRRSRALHWPSRPLSTNTHPHAVGIVITELAYSRGWHIAAKISLFCCLKPSSSRTPHPEPALSSQSLGISPTSQGINTIFPAPYPSHSTHDGRKGK